MSEVLYAKCGLDCAQCDAYIATKNNDIDALQKMADEAKKQFAMEFTADQSRCTGCSSDGVKISYTEQCAVRKCAVEKGVENCAHCGDFGCETIKAFLEKAPKAKANLERIRATLN